MILGQATARLIPGELTKEVAVRKFQHRIGKIVLEQRKRQFPAVIPQRPVHAGKERVDSVHAAIFVRGRAAGAVTLL